MNLIEALEKLRDGEMVRHKGWPKGKYISIKNGQVAKFDTGNTFHFSSSYEHDMIDMNDLTKDGWEVFEYGFVDGLYTRYRALDKYYLRYKGIWYMWTCNNRWMRLNNHWEVEENYPEITTYIITAGTPDDVVKSKMELVRDGNFDPDKHEMRMELCWRST